MRRPAEDHPSHFSAGRLLLRQPQDGDRADRAWPSQVVAQPQARVLHLSPLGAALELLGDFAEHAAAGGADGMAEALQATAGVDRDLAVDVRVTLADELRAFALLTELKILAVQDLGDGEAVVHLGEVDLLGGVLDPRLLVRLLRRGLRRREAQPVEGSPIHRQQGVHGQRVGLGHRVIVLVLALLGDLGPGDHQRGRPVGHAAAVEAPQGPGDHGGVHRRLQGDGTPEVGLGVKGAVLVVLDGYASQILPGPAVLVEATRGQQSEHGRGAGAAHHRVPHVHGQAGAAHVHELLDSAGQHHVVGSGGDRKAGVAEGIHARGTEVLHARGRLSEELEGLGGDTAAQAGEIVEVAHPGRFDVVRGDPGIVHRLEGGLHHQVFGVLLPELTELGAADAHDRCLVLDASHEILLLLLRWWRRPMLRSRFRHGPALPVVVVEARCLVQAAEDDLRRHADLDLLRVAVGHREEDAAPTLQVQHQPGHGHVDVLASLEVVECEGVDAAGLGQLDLLYLVLGRALLAHPGNGVQHGAAVAYTDRRGSSARC